MTHNSALERDVVAGSTTLAELGARIDAPAWLAERAVTVIDAVAGKLPVRWTPDGTVATVALPDTAIVYLVVDEKLTRGELHGGLRHAPGCEHASSAVVQEVAVR